MGATRGKAQEAPGWDACLDTCLYIVVMIAIVSMLYVDCTFKIKVLQLALDKGATYLFCVVLRTLCVFCLNPQQWIAGLINVVLRTQNGFKVSSYSIPSNGLPG